MQRRISSTPCSHGYSDSRSCSITGYQQSGRPQIIAIDVEIELQSVKSATTAQCHSMYSTKHQRTDSSSKNSKCLPIRSVPSAQNLTLVAHCIFLMIMLNFFGRDFRIYGVKGGF